MDTVALVGKDGSIDFMCFPRFDSPTVFAALLDPEKGGRFQLAPEAAEARQVQLYLPGLGHPAHAVPLRRGRRRGVGLHARGGAPRGRWCAGRRRSAARSPSACSALRGSTTAAAHHRIERRSEREWLFASEGADRVAFLLRSDVPLSAVNGDAVASFTLGAGQTASFVLEEVMPGEPAACEAPQYVSASFKRTNDFWRKWIARSTYRGRWREIVNRSALTLKLLTSDAHGSMVAAPTFGLPERLGGERNWDYRYTWIRDASFALYAAHAPRLHRRGARLHELGRGALRRARCRTARCRSCTASMGATTSPRRRCRHCRATAARGRCASATPRTISCSSTSTAS